MLISLFRIFISDVFFYTLGASWDREEPMDIGKTTDAHSFTAIHRNQAKSQQIKQKALHVARERVWVIGPLIDSKFPLQQLYRWSADSARIVIIQKTIKFIDFLPNLYEQLTQLQSIMGLWPAVVRPIMLYRWFIYPLYFSTPRSCFLFPSLLLRSCEKQNIAVKAVL